MNMGLELPFPDFFEVEGEGGEVEAAEFGELSVGEFDEGAELGDYGEYVGGFRCAG